MANPRRSEAGFPRGRRWRLCYVLRLTISLDTQLGHTAPNIEGGVHGEIEDGTRFFLAEEDGGRTPRAAG